MFFYEWVVPTMALMFVAAWSFYVSVKNRTGAGIRTDGRVMFDQETGENHLPAD
jgi:hypothetical protein